MIPIRSLLGAHDLSNKGSIHDKIDIQPLTSSLDHSKKSLELADDFLGTKQSVYELCAILGVSVLETPLMFFEKLRQLKLSNDATEERNKQLNNQR